MAKGKNAGSGQQVQQSTTGDEGTGVIGKIGAGETTEVRAAYDAIFASRAQAEEKLRVAARLVATDGQLSEQDRKDLADLIVQAGWTPELFECEVENQKTRDRRRATIRQAKEAAEQLTLQEATLEEALATRLRLIAEQDAIVRAAAAGVAECRSIIRQAESATKFLISRAPLSMRQKLKSAQQQAADLDLARRDAEREADLLASEHKRWADAAAAFAPGGAQHTEAQTRADAIKVDLDRAVEKRDVVQRRLQEARDDIAEFTRLCEIA